MNAQRNKSATALLGLSHLLCSLFCSPYVDRPQNSAPPQFPERQCSPTRTRGGTTSLNEDLKAQLGKGTCSPRLTENPYSIFILQPFFPACYPFYGHPPLGLSPHISPALWGGRLWSRKPFSLLCVFASHFPFTPWAHTDSSWRLVWATHYLFFFFQLN